MSTNLVKTLAAFAAALCLIGSAQAEYRSDPMLVTAIGQATVSSIGNFAHRNRCVKVIETQATSAYEGECFGFPSEVMSSFDFDRFGRLVRSRIFLTDADYALSRIRAISLVRGPAREVITASALTDRILEWKAGDETWRFIEKGTTGEWEFVRELSDPASRPDPADLPSELPPEPVYGSYPVYQAYSYPNNPYYPSYPEWYDRRW